MQKVLPFILVAALLIIGASAYALSGDKQSDKSTEQATATNQSTSVKQDDNTTQQQSYSIEEVAQRDSKEACWTIIDGKVYDITSYIPRHPGGDDILLACGEDGSSLFNQRQTDDGKRIGSGTPHSNSATRSLSSYQIGTLQN